MSGQPAHHADVVQAAIATNDAARSALIASWRRSLTLHGLDPAERKAPRRLTEGELRQARQRMEPLLRAADASLDRLYLAVGGIGCCVMLADRDGIPIERRGASADDDTFDEWGLWTGTVWSEDSEGTAALDVSSCRSDLTEDFVNLISVAVGDAARRIEADNFRRAFSNARILLAPATECGASTLLAVDADDLVVGATRSARLALGITQQGLTKGLPAADILGDSANAAEELGEAERGVIQRAITRADGNVSAAAQTLGISRATLHRKLARFGIRRPH
ncbi:helix-turn-helix domain-containing protein [Mesorhizobium sp. WSM2561]|uniref:helix-turn-helix domain-containing protein n=1 Tax=Mesorhizobium sp. WSM2561 TaxID=1040985 RepID=UPI000483E448|nr:helix-turn-helix domain-containing protein [Mesorhizobium sp. WSM2561]